MTLVFLNLDKNEVFMVRRRYRHEWESLAFIDADFIGGWGAFDGYSGPMEFDGLEPSEADCQHDRERDVFSVFYSGQADGKPALRRANIILERLPQTLGGARVHFRAPCCGRRIRKLALLPEGVVCGRCGSITHRSRRKSGLQRLIHKADMLAGQLGCETWFSSPKERPKHMRRERFMRLAEQHAELVRQANVMLGPRLARAARRGVAAHWGVMLRAGM